jgi:hypothetical protein
MEIIQLIFRKGLPVPVAAPSLDGIAEKEEK